MRLAYLLANPVQGPSRNNLMCSHGSPVVFLKGKWRHMASKQPCKFVVVAHHYL